MRSPRTNVWLTATRPAPAQSYQQAVCTPVLFTPRSAEIGTASANCRADAVPPHARGRHELPPLGRQKQMFGKTCSWLGWPCSTRGPAVRWPRLHNNNPSSPINRYAQRRPAANGACGLSSGRQTAEKFHKIFGRRSSTEGRVFYGHGGRVRVVRTEYAPPSRRTSRASVKSGPDGPCCGGLAVVHCRHEEAGMIGEDALLSTQRRRA